MRDEILSRAVDPLASPLSREATGHLETCAGCRDFEKAWPVVNRLGMTWRAADPPPGLALRTIAGLKPAWTERKRPITRQEVRLLWSSGLAMAGAAAVILLMFVDRVFPLGSSMQVETLLRLGVKVAFLQLVGAGLVSLIVLAVRRARSSKPPRGRPESAGPREESARGSHDRRSIE